jgi:hypothetical protein
MDAKILAAIAITKALVDLIKWAIPTLQGTRTQWVALVIAAALSWPVGHTNIADYLQTLGLVFAGAIAVDQVIKSQLTRRE